MKVSAIISLLFEIVSSQIDLREFKVYLGSNKMVRRSKSNILSIELEATREDEYITLLPFVYLQNKEVHKFFKKINGTKNELKYTIGNQLLKLDRFYIEQDHLNNKNIGSWVVRDEAQCKKLGSVFAAYLSETIFPYFNENASIERVDKLLNQHFDKVIVHHHWYPERVCVGIIVAYLNQNPNLFEIISAYETKILTLNSTHFEDFFTVKEWILKQ